MDDLYLPLDARFLSHPTPQTVAGPAAQASGIQEGIPISAGRVNTRKPSENRGFANTGGTAAQHSHHSRGLTENGCSRMRNCRTAMLALLLRSR